MKHRPIPVIIVAFLFILSGCVGVAYHFGEFYEDDVALNEVLWVMTLRVLAVICGLLLLFRVNWSRWLAIAWLAYHVVITFHAPTQMFAHIVLLGSVMVLLFLPVSSVYFRSKDK